MIQFAHPSTAPAIMAQYGRKSPHDRCVLVVLGFSKEYAEAVLKTRPNMHLVVFDPSVDPSRIRGARLQVFADMWALGRDFPFVLARRYGLRIDALPGTKMRWPSHWADLLAFVRKQKQNIHSDIVTACRFAYEWQRNSLENLRYIAKSARIGDSFGRFAGVPGVLVASGPSLDDSIEDLRRLSDGAFLLAVGSAAPRLEAEGLTPDAVMAFDGGLANWIAHFEGMELRCPLIYDPIIYHRIPPAWSGDLVAMQIWPFHFYERTIGALGHVEVGPSVANSAFDLLFKLGCDPIVLAGQDLAFKHDRIHALGTHKTRLAETLKPANYEIVKLPKVGGGEVMSNGVFRTYLNTFECRIAAAKRQRPVTVINTSGGARIPDTIDMPISRLRLQADKPSLVTEPPDVDLGLLREQLEQTYAAGKHVFDHAEGLEYPGALLTKDLEPLSFVLQPIWNNSRCETDQAWACRELRAGLRFALPLVRRVSLELEKR